MYSSIRGKGRLAVTMATASDDAGQDVKEGSITKRIFCEDDTNKRSSYFEMLTNISNELDFMLKDLKKNDNFTPTSPSSPLSATNSGITFEYRDSSSVLASDTPAKAPDENLSLQLPLQPPSGYSASTPLSPLSAPLRPFTLPLHGEEPPPQPLLPGPAPTLSPTLAPSAAPIPASMGSILAEFGPSLEDSSLPMKTRLVHSKPLWFLPETQRAAAAHYLQGQPVGTFVVRQARQKDKVSLTVKHPGSGKGPFIESYPIESSQLGVKLSSEDMVFSSLDDLITEHFHTEGALPCRLALPMAIMAARNLREIQSLAVLEEEFWKSSHSKSPSLQPQQETSPSEHSSGKSELLDRQYPQKPLNLHEEDARTKQRIQLGNLLSDVCDDRPGGPKPTAGEYGIITGPPVIYENADAEDKILEHRPQSLDSMTGFSPVAIYGKTGDRSSKCASSQRPASESDRQDMRFSTASEYEMVTSTTEQRYPPPRCAPPPPPVGVGSFDTFTTPALPPKIRDSMNAVQYSLPYDQPPLPPKKSPTPFSTHGMPQAAKPRQPTTPTGYGQPVPGSEKHDPYQAPQSTVSSFNNRPQQQQQPLTGLPLPNYSAPPPPAKLHSTAGAESPCGLVHAEAEQQIQNILRPISTADSTADGDEAVPWTPLLEFDPLFEFGQPGAYSNTAAAAGADQDNTMRNFWLSDLEHSVKAVRLTERQSSPSLNNNTKSNKMAPSLPERHAKSTNLMQFGSPNKDYLITDEKPFWGRETEENYEEESFSHSMDNSSEESEDEVMSPTTMEPVGFPHTENENGNHALLGQSVEELEMDDSRETEKKEYMKRNKSSQLHKMLLRAKKGSKGATKKLRKSKKKQRRDPIVDIHDIILRVASNKTIGLGALVSSFIRTQEEKCMVDKPDIVLRSIRQYMSGIKNYLLNRREPEIDEVIDKYFPQVINESELESIIEGALHQCVLEPLKSDIGLSCLQEYKSNGTMELMDHNFMEAKQKSPEQLGIKENYVPPEGADLDDIRQLFSDLQEAFSPIKKLDLLLKIVSTIYNSVHDKNSGRKVTNSMGADDFLPMLIYVLVQCEMIGIEIEADYMWGLLDPSMLSGEGGYYLTTLSSAICVLKQFEEETKTEMKGFLTVLVASFPDPVCLSLKTQPVLPGMTAAEVCRNLAHGMKITDAEAEMYRLYLLKESNEILVDESECPLQIKMDEEADGFRGCRFGFRPETAKVQWP